MYMDFELPLVLTAIVFIAAIVVGYYFWQAVCKRHMEIWLLPFIMSKKIRPDESSVIHTMVCFADHYEPKWQNPSSEVQWGRVDNWQQEYPKRASAHLDADGRHPTHTFFYPIDEYDEKHAEAIIELCKGGWGEFEVHFHHEGDTTESLTEIFTKYVQDMHDKYGVFPLHPETGKPAWVFVHGNWTLCNSGPQGQWCGVEEELLVLDQTGCVMDMTLPSAPSPTQTSTINSIYYASNVEGRPKSHDKGVLARFGSKKKLGNLLMVQGPLGIRWKRRSPGIGPMLENGDISGQYPPSLQRTKYWKDHPITITGAPNWQFLKLHTHGAQERNQDIFLTDKFDDLHKNLQSVFNDGQKRQLHYVSAREMYNIIKAAEDGLEGNPNSYRDYSIPRPEYKNA